MSGSESEWLSDPPTALRLLCIQLRIFCNKNVLDQDEKWEHGWFWPDSSHLEGLHGSPWRRLEFFLELPGRFQLVSCYHHLCRLPGGPRGFGHMLEWSISPFCLSIEGCRRAKIKVEEEDTLITWYRRRVFDRLHSHMWPCNARDPGRYMVTCGCEAWNNILF
jgi:hypothetical protein